MESTVQTQAETSETAAYEEQITSVSPRIVQPEIQASPGDRPGGFGVLMPPGGIRSEQLKTQEPTATAASAKTSSPTEARPTAKYYRSAAFDRQVRDLKALADASLAGDKAAMDELREKLDKSPQVWQMLGDLCRLVEEKLASEFSDCPLRWEALKKRNSAMRQQLAGEGSSLCTQMAASRMVLCWMFTQFLELKLFDELAHSKVQVALKHAEGRYLTAVRAYELSRRGDLFAAN